MRTDTETAPAPLAPDHPLMGMLRDYARAYASCGHGQQGATEWFYRAESALTAELAKYVADAERWRAIRPYLSVDGDSIGIPPSDMAVQWIRASGDRLCDAAQPGWTHTVESLADALAARATEERPDVE